MNRTSADIVYKLRLGEIRAEEGVVNVGISIVKNQEAPSDADLEEGLCVGFEVSGVYISDNRESPCSTFIPLPWARPLAQFPE